MLVIKSHFHVSFLFLYAMRSHNSFATLKCIDLVNVFDSSITWNQNYDSAKAVSISWFLFNFIFFLLFFNSLFPLH